VVREFWRNFDMMISLSVKGAAQRAVGLRIMIPVHSH